MTTINIEIQDLNINKKIEESFKDIFNSIKNEHKCLKLDNLIINIKIEDINYGE